VPLHIIFLLALIQGATEFLPVSSSAHLALLPDLIGVATQPVVMDVAVHVGTLFAVLLYYSSDTAAMLRGFGHLLCGRLHTPAAQLVRLLALATIPVIVAGFILHLTNTADLLRDPALIGTAMIVFAIPLYLADQIDSSHRKTSEWSPGSAIIMGLAQALALIPGASRSGVTMTAARWIGYGREEGARLSMLMSVPTIIASAALLGLDAATTTPAMLAPALMAAGISFCIAYASIGIMLGIFRRFSMTPFVIYRLVLGCTLLVIP